MVEDDLYDVVDNGFLVGCGVIFSVPDNVLVISLTVGDDAGSLVDEEDGTGLSSPR